MAPRLSKIHVPAFLRWGSPSRAPGAPRACLPMNDEWGQFRAREIFSAPPQLLRRLSPEDRKLIMHMDFSNGCVETLVILFRRRLIRQFCQIYSVPAPLPADSCKGDIIRSADFPAACQNIIRALIMAKRWSPEDVGTVDLRSATAALW